MKCIHELFEAQAERTPDTLAAVFKDGSLTYRELDRRAEAVALRLRALGVGRDALVALFLERSLDLIAGMLGVLKAGGAYLPLDPGHPRKRLAYIMADAQPLALLTQQRLQRELPPHQSQVVTIDAEAPPVQPPASVLDRLSTPSDLAYVIYTSGSTGEPKGVQIEHRSVVNMLASMQRRPGLAAVDSMLAITTPAFDISVLEIFLPLVCGARVVVAGGEVVGDPMALADLIRRSGVNVMQATPATLRMLLDAGWEGGGPELKILCGGEAWTSELAALLLPRCGSLWNMYGPTETTVWSAVARVESGQPVLIGPPIAQTRLYVLDRASQLVPVGVAGELHIAGEGLARGYLRRPELTRERFVPDPYAAQPGARMYRTGDQVRRLPNGALEFLGRLDHQVKIRGHRIELGEIEAALQRLAGIERCAVVARDDVPEGRRLVAYVIPAAGSAFSVSELRLQLAQTLPEYMLPSAFVTLAAFPLTPNGKLDRKALPRPEASSQDAGAAPLEARTPTESVIAEIWCQVLGRARVGVRDNFFHLGGYSLLAVRVVSEINKALHVQLSIPAFFTSPTIEGLTQVLERDQHVKREPRVIALRSGRVGLPIYLMGARPHEYRIAQWIEGDRTLYLLDVPMAPEGLPVNGATDATAFPTVEQVSAPYSDLLCAHAGSSPCVIIGYSLGGRIAFEAARALQRTGGNVALVLLVDAWVIAPRDGIRLPAWQSLLSIWRNLITPRADASWMRRLGASFGDLSSLAGWVLARVPRSARFRLGRLTSRLSKAESGPPPLAVPSGYFDLEGRSVDFSIIQRLTYSASRMWHPQPLDALGVLIRAPNPDQETLPRYDRTNGWRDLFTRGLEVVDAGGDHFSIVVGENAAILVRQIGSILDRYGASVRRPEPASAIAHRGPSLAQGAGARPPAAEEAMP